MIFIFGLNLIQLTGYLTSLFFILSFFGCRCHLNSRICNWRIIQTIIKYHKVFIYVAILILIIHGSLATLSKFGVII